MDHPGGGYLVGMVKSPQHFSVDLLGQSSDIFGTEDWTHGQVGITIFTSIWIILEEATW